MTFHPVEVLVGLVAAAVGRGVMARWLRLPYPTLLVTAGLLLGLQPWAPRQVRLEPQVVFLLFLPPLLYAGAFNTEWADFRRQLRAIRLLAVGLVPFTTACVAAVAHYYLGLPWAAGVVLGAIVSPPDAVAALAVTQRVKVPRIVSTILEGESLVNDASALVAYWLAVAAVVAGTFSAAGAVGDFFLVSGGGIGIGLAGGWVAVRMTRWLDRTDPADPKLTITVTLLTPYAVYLPAEHLHVSGVLAAVTAGLGVGSRCEGVFSPDLYREARAVWVWVEFVLNSLIFPLIGFMPREVLEPLGESYDPWQLAEYAAAVSLVAIAALLAWMFPGAYVPRWLDRVVLGRGDPYPPWQSVVVVGWTGMRGVVSLAAALALPLKTGAGTSFPGRDPILFLTFWVIFATLVGQGLTLPLVIRGLGVDRLGDAEQPDEPPPSC